MPYNNHRERERTTQAAGAKLRQPGVSQHLHHAGFFRDPTRQLAVRCLTRPSSLRGEDSRGRDTRQSVDGVL